MVSHSIFWDNFNKLIGAEYYVLVANYYFQSCLYEKPMWIDRRFLSGEKAEKVGSIPYSIASFLLALAN